MTPAFDLDDLVLADDAAAQLRRARRARRARSTSCSTGGASGARLPRGQGVAALFAGPPGTGKTMAAEAVAERARPGPLPDRPVGGRLEVHRRDREEPRGRLRRGRAGRRGPVLRRGRRAVRQAHRGHATPTTATPTSRSTTCCSASRRFTGLVAARDQPPGRDRRGVPAPAALRRSASSRPTPRCAASCGGARSRPARGVGDARLGRAGRRRAGRRHASSRRRSSAAYLAAAGDGVITPRTSSTRCGASTRSSASAWTGLRTGGRP